MASFAAISCRWHIEGEITHDWKKLAERKAKQLRKLSDTYKGQLDKVLPAIAFLDATCSSSSCCTPLCLCEIEASSQYVVAKRSITVC